MEKKAFASVGGFHSHEPVPSSKVNKPINYVQQLEEMRTERNFWRLCAAFFMVACAAMAVLISR